jgi:hypothetical protein
LIFFDLLHPGIRLQLADRKTNALAVAVHADNPDLDFLADFEHLIGVLDAVPGDLGQVDQAIGAVDIDESAKVCQAGYSPGALCAFLELIQQAVLEVSRVSCRARTL